jgi:hypothetical protein
VNNVALFPVSLDQLRLELEILTTESMRSATRDSSSTQVVGVQPADRRGEPDHQFGGMSWHSTNLRFVLGHTFGRIASSLVTTISPRQQINKL